MTLSADQVDVCVAVEGPNAKELAATFASSLLRTSDISGYLFHIVNKNEDTAATDNLVSRLHVGGASALCRRKDPEPEHVRRNTALDVAATYDWMCRNCGDRSWVLLTHLDLLFEGDLFLWMRDRVDADDVAMVGEHCPAVLIRRDVYAQCFSGWNSMAALKVVPIPASPEMLRLRYQYDPRAASGQYVQGFDNGELLELEVWTRGYRVVPFPNPGQAPHAQHRRGGSGLHGEQVNREIRQWALGHR